jgi:iron complex outermembrane receptor protein
MAVASVNASQFSVTSRGFSNLFANKLLVLVDGRAVYSPVFAGVYWDVEQAMLEDVDRIEVIRGPGATVWGANAVNGVINVVSRDARDTQGALVYGSAGDVLETDSGVRYGGRIGERTYYRVYAGVRSVDDHPRSDGRPAGDGWQGQQGGLRVDHHVSDDTQLTWQAGGTSFDTDDDAIEDYNANTLGRLTRRWSDRSSLEIQTYFDHTMRNEPERARLRTDTGDFSAQHTFGLGERHDFIWGLGYRVIDTEVDQTSPLLEVRDGEARTDLYSFFVQDEFQVVPEKLTLTSGVKLEHNDFTGFEVQPGLRLAFKPTARQTLWTAISRAVRTPGSLEGHDLLAVATGAPFVGPGGGLYIPRVTGNTDLASEELWAYECGYRVQPISRVSVDLALFYNVYDDLASASQVTGLVPGVPFGTAEIPFANTLSAQTYGGELAVTVSPIDAWRLTGTYSLLLADVNGPASADLDALEHSAPRHQATLRSSHDLTRRLSVDGQLRYVDAIRFVPSYFTADLRIAYRISDNLEIALVGRNLLQDQHLEQGPSFYTDTAEVPRSFYGKLTWRY